VSAVRSILGHKAAEWKVVSQERVWPPAINTTIDVIRVEIPQYVDRGYKGRLVLTFKRDLLTRTEFFPTDFDGYLHKLDDELGTSLRDREYRRGHLVIWAWTLEPDRKAIGWRDQELTELFDSSG
jgi:hypothetical protein